MRRFEYSGEPSSSESTSLTRLAAGDRAAAQFKITTFQVALAWLLWRSPVILPIPGTSRVPHLEENVAAASLKLDEGKLRELGQAFHAADQATNH